MKQITIDKKQIHQGNLILVNAKYALRENEKVNFVQVGTEGENTLLKCEAAKALQRIFEKIGSKEQIATVSGYRTEGEQRQIYEDSLRDNGRSFTEKYVALPNHSEHQTGLAIDLGLKKEKIDFIRPDFPNEGICKRFREEAVKSGFVERYGRDKEEITGIAHEPWHFRYVGYPHSELISNRHLALEEYMEYVKEYTLHGQHLQVGANRNKTEIFYVPFDGTDTMEIAVPEDALCQVSGNNVDGVIVTLWRCFHG